jgi:multiple sugar transport system ATP-binding protein
MKDGFIQQIGTPQEVFMHPANIFVAGFIGVPQMNFFHGCRLSKKDGGYAATLLGKDYALSAAQSHLLAEKNVADCTVTIGVRPVDMKGHAAEDGDAVIEVAEMMGSEVHLHMTRDGEDIIAIVSSREADLSQFEAGRKMALQFDPAAMHIFDSKTEENLLPCAEE